MAISKKQSSQHPSLHLRFLGFLTACASMVLDFPAGRAEMSARSLDALLQERAFRALAWQRTGVPCDGDVPPGLAGIGVSAVRLRSGSVRRKGFRGFNEFSIPAGVAAQPYAERLVLVYHNLGNWSGFYYPLPESFVYLTPVLGLLAYDASDLSASEPPELDLWASEAPFLIKFSRIKPAPAPAQAKCAFFDWDGSLEFDIIVDGNICRGTKEGHFAIVVELPASGQAGKLPAADIDGSKSSGDNNGFKKILFWVIFGTAIGGVVILGFLILVLACMKKRSEEKKTPEEASERDVALQMNAAGHTAAPVVSRSRKSPMWEDEYVA
ncbi:unnamed protein product [Cuscuta campestris]|uniref:Uncharacterized protein n=1 Tax=Cuscuta campestris TaxID=132261 RepID=A0A484NLI0_9ASTE|nr:unnamed protein product [Cuscuta campestris]